jgi:hypothetical protein
VSLQEAPKLPGGLSFERYPQRQGELQSGTVLSVDKSGYLICRLRSGGVVRAIPTTPSKTVGLGYEAGDNLLLFVEYDGTVYAVGFIPPVTAEDRSVNHPLQRKVGGKEVRMSEDLDDDKSGFSLLRGGVTRSSSGPTSQSVSTPSKNKKIDVFENYELQANSGSLEYFINALGQALVELSGRAVNFPIASAKASKIRFDKTGIHITFDTAKQVPGARESVSGPTSKIELDNLGSVKIEAGLLNSTLKAPVNVTIDAGVLLQLTGTLIRMAGGGPSAARRGDLVDGGDHVGIIMTGSNRVFVG